MSVLVIILTYAGWSSVFALGKMAVASSTPAFVTGFRMLLAGSLLFTYLALTKRSAFNLRLKNFFSIALLGFFSIYLCNILELWGLKYLSAAKTCFIYSLGPFFSALFSYLHFNERMNRRKWIGLGIGFLGIVPVLMTQTGSEELLHAFSFFTWPTLAVIGAALAGIYGWVLLRLLVKDNEVSPLMASGGSMLLGGAFALVHSLFSDAWTPFPITEAGTFFKSTFGLLLISNIICYNLYGMLLKKFTATFLSFMGLLSPVFASFCSWLLLGETPSWLIFLSTGIVSFGLWIVYQAEIKQGYILIKKPLASTDESA